MWWISYRVRLPGCWRIGNHVAKELVERRYVFIQSVFFVTDEPLCRKKFSCSEGKTTISVLHDAQLLSNKQQQIWGGVYIHWHILSSTNTVLLPWMPPWMYCDNALHRRTQDFTMEGFMWWGPGHGNGSPPVGCRGKAPVGGWWTKSPEAEAKCEISVHF